MSARALALLLVILPAAGLAGCLAGEEATTPSANNAEENTTPVAPGALPDNRSGEFSAFKETNATEDGKGGLEHHHDNWGGQTRIDLFVLRAMMWPRPSASGTSAVFHMPPGALVYEGTSQVEFTVSNPQRHVCDPSAATFGGEHTCTSGSGFGTPEVPTVPDPNPPTLKLEYMHAAASEWIPLGDLAWGTPFIIPISNPAETDMPHATTSLWQFRVLSSSPADVTLTFDVSATIIRGPAGIPLWPGHPDFYKETRFRTVYDGTVAIREGGQLTALLGRQFEPAKPEKLISYGTKTLYVYANITGYEGTPGFAPTNWYLYYKNATGDWNITDIYDANNAVESAKSLKFVLKVDDAGMDTPYAPSSRWEFLVRGALANCYSGCAAYSAEYTLTVIATDLLADEYTCGGIAETVCPTGAKEEGRKR
ncbi:MAG TPA: hypothetical protein VNZ52_08085 [Candidatus Thermoplasmatota archaeon]|nr:hypothetical protein [Candidatus Thermoplasmatota archaeon]